MVAFFASILLGVLTWENVGGRVANLVCGRFSTFAKWLEALRL